MFSVVATTRNSSTTQRNRRTTREKWTVTWFWSCAVACLTVVVVRSHPILKSLSEVGKKRWAKGTIEGTCWTVNQPKMITQRINRLQQSKRQEILCYHKLCEKYYRKSRKYMRNNSTKQKGKKNSTSHYRSKVRAQRYGDKLPKNTRDVNALETIWIIVDETSYKDPAPKTVDELRQWLRFAWKNVTFNTLWELVHSIPHRLEIVRRHTGRRSGY